jgi:hypothetical protein
MYFIFAMCNVTVFWYLRLPSKHILFSYQRREMLCVSLPIPHKIMNIYHSCIWFAAMKNECMEVKYLVEVRVIMCRCSGLLQYVSYIYVLMLCVCSEKIVLFCHPHSISIHVHVHCQSTKKRPLTVEMALTWSEIIMNIKRTDSSKSFHTTGTRNNH